MGCFINIFWKIRENFTVGDFKEGRSGYTEHNYFFALFRILAECYFIDMRFCFHRPNWEWMGAGFFFTRKMFKTSYFLDSNCKF